MNDVRYLGVKEVCEQVGVHRSTIYRAMDAGFLKFGSVGPVGPGRKSRRRFTQTQIDNWLSKAKKMAKVEEPVRAAAAA